MEAVEPEFAVPSRKAISAILRRKPCDDTLGKLGALTTASWTELTTERYVAVVSLRAEVENAQCCKPAAETYSGKTCECVLHGP